MLPLFDRVRETSGSMGTGDLVLDGAVKGFQTFDIVGDGRECYYVAFDSLSGAWETGVAVFHASPRRLERKAIVSSSTGGGIIDFPSGSKDVFLTLPALMLQRAGGNGLNIPNYWNSLIVPDALPDITSPLDDHFKGGVLSSKWKFPVNPTSNGATTSIADDVLSMTLPSGGGDTMHAYMQALPAGNFAAFVKLLPPFTMGDSGFAGLVLSDARIAGSGTQFMSNILIQNGHVYTRCDLFQYFNRYYSNWTSHDIASSAPGRPIYLRMRRDGSTYYVSWSWDGMTWYDETSHTHNYNLAYIGIFASNSSSVTKTFHFEVFQYVASSTATMGRTAYSPVYFDTTEPTSPNDDAELLQWMM